MRDKASHKMSWKIIYLLVPATTLLAVGLIMENYYLSVLGILMLCGIAATLTLPRPPRGER